MMQSTRSFKQITNPSGEDFKLEVLVTFIKGTLILYISKICAHTHVDMDVKYDTHVPLDYSLTAGTTMMADSIWKSSHIFVQYTAVTIRFFTHHI
jgi:hypothetical protein